MGTTKIKNISPKKGNTIDIGVRRLIHNVSRRIHIYILLTIPTPSVKDMLNIKIVEM
jgi:hypothetical protein